MISIVLALHAYVFPRNFRIKMLAEYSNEHYLLWISIIVIKKWILIMDSNQKRVQTGGVLHAFYAIERDNGHRLRELVKIDYARTRPHFIIIIIRHWLEFIIKTTKKNRSRVCAEHCIQCNNGSRRKVRAIFSVGLVDMRVIFFVAVYFMDVCRSLSSFFFRFIVDSLLPFYWINIKLPSIDSEWSSPSSLPTAQSASFWAFNNNHFHNSRLTHNDDWHCCVLINVSISFAKSTEFSASEMAFDFVHQIEIVLDNGQTAECSLLIWCVDDPNFR